MEEQGDLVAAHLFVGGRVQGVGFRSYSLDCAKALQVFGLVRNLSDGRVELVLEGDRGRIEALILKLRQGPPRSKVTDIDVSWRKIQAEYKTFSIAY